jgi:hypothetical protein
MLRFVPALLLCAACASDAAPDRTGADSVLPVASAIPTLPRVGPAAPDSGPGVRVERTGTARRLVMEPAPGDQINALQPPYVAQANGARLQFSGPDITADSAYFVGEVSADVPAALLPLRGTLTTSYCKAGEQLCRTATRAIDVR